MTSYAVIDSSKVVNIVLWDGDANSWPESARLNVVPIPAGVTCAIGYGWDGKAFIKPAGETGQVQTVPPAVTMRQARLALLDAGKYAAVDQAIAGMGGDAGARAQIEWNAAATVERNSPIVGMLGQLLSLTSKDLDNLFLAAIKL